MGTSGRHLIDDQGVSCGGGGGGDLGGWTGDDQLSGGGGDGDITGWSGNDPIAGGGGNDDPDGGDAVDRLLGQGGSDDSTGTAASMMSATVETQSTRCLPTTRAAGFTARRASASRSGRGRMSADRAADHLMGRPVTA